MSDDDDGTGRTESVEGAASLCRSRRPRILLGVTGSVAAVRWEELTLALLSFADVRVVHTRSALHFSALCGDYAPETSKAWAAAAAEARPGSSGAAASDATLVDESARLGLLGDAVEWESYARVGSDAVIHIELRAWADAFLVAPLSAHTMAKLAGGFADNLVTTAARAWPFSGGRVAKPFIIAPAMNSDMWAHPVTLSQLTTLRDWGVRVVNPVVKRLACGDIGAGALPPISDIVLAVKQEMGLGCK
jgi:phosphopantothenoylcysteine decarboxylase